MVGENPIEIPGADCSCPVLNQVANRGFICGSVVCCTHLDLLLMPDVRSGAFGQATALQFANPPHMAFASSQHIAQNTLNPASWNHPSVERPLSATSVFSHSRHHASARAVSASSPQKNPTRSPESTAKAMCLHTSPMPCSPGDRQFTFFILRLTLADEPVMFELVIGRFYIKHAPTERSRPTSAA